MEFVMERAKTLEEAKRHHQHWGGVLLIDDDGSFMIVSIEKDVAAFGRSSAYLDNLAPSWSEAHPDNIVKLKHEKPVQLSLF